MGRVMLICILPSRLVIALQYPCGSNYGRLWAFVEPFGFVSTEQLEPNPVASPAGISSDTHVITVCCRD